VSLVSRCLLAAGLLAGADPSAPLVPGQPLTATFTAGETHTSAVTLAAGQFLRLSVVQDGADVVVTVIAPDGTARRAGDQEGEARAFFWRCIAQQYLSREDEASGGRAARRPARPPARAALPRPLLLGRLPAAGRVALTGRHGSLA
jgi:hypothetical protein